MHADIAYVVSNRNGDTPREIGIRIDFHKCCYFDFKRISNHEPGSGIIYEAYLKENSQLIESLKSHKLDGDAGDLYPQTNSQQPILHFEIAGEISLNIICQEIICWSTLDV